MTSILLNDLKLGKLDFVIFNESDVKETNIYQKKLTELKQGFIYNPLYFKDEVKNISDLNKYPLIFQKKESNSRKFLDYITQKNNVKLILQLISPFCDTSLACFLSQIVPLFGIRECWFSRYNILYLYSLFGG